MAKQLSVAVPVFRDAVYARAAIESALCLAPEDAEVVVSLNDCSDRFHAGLVGTFPDVRVLRTPRPSTMAEHYEWCLQHLSGEWLTILGADDAVLPNVTRDIKFAVQNFPNIRAISWSRIYYFWPGVEDVYRTRGGVAKWQDGATVWPGLATVIRGLRGDVEHFEFPQMYTNNAIHRSIYDDAIRRHGSYYFERHPDVSSGVFNALSCRYFMHYAHPAFITGTSDASSGLAIHRQRETGIPHERAAEFVLDPPFGLPASSSIRSLNLKGKKVLSKHYVISAVEFLPRGTPWGGLLRWLSRDQDSYRGQLASLATLMARIGQFLLATLRGDSAILKFKIVSRIKSIVRTTRPSTKTVQCEKCTMAEFQQIVSRTLNQG